MNYWIEKSIELANDTEGYLDSLSEIYPMNPEFERLLNTEKLKTLKILFDEKESYALITELLKIDLFPIKDSYVAYLKRDKTALARNPLTIKRIAERIYEMGYEQMIVECSKPKETNRQIGPMFRNWLYTKSGFQVVNLEAFTASQKGIVFLQGSDGNLFEYAKQHLNYYINKGLDFIIKKDTQHIIGETKFLTDFGGHQNAQFNDAYHLVAHADKINAVCVAILDGVVWIRGNNKMYKQVVESDYNIFSGLLLKEFIDSI